MANANSNVIEFMRARRSVPARNITAPGPDEIQLRSMIEIAVRVPDHGKLAPWRFIRYSPGYCRTLGEKFAARARELNPDISAEMQAIERERFSTSPTVIAVVSRAASHPKIPQWEQVLSAGAAAMNLLIAANANGWDAQWITEWVAYDEALSPDLGVGRDERIAGFIHMGTRNLPKTERERPNIDDIYVTIGG